MNQPSRLQRLPCSLDFIPQGNLIQATTCPLWVTWPQGPDIILLPGQSMVSPHRHTLVQVLETKRAQSATVPLAGPETGACHAGQPA